MDAVQILRDMVEAKGTTQVSRELGVSRMAIWGVLNGKWGAGPKLLTALGLKKVERVVRA